MADKIGEEYPGIISSVTKFGLFIELENTIEGLIHINKLKMDYFHYIEKHMALVGERTGKTFKLGQKVVIKVEKADPETREIDFELISSEDVAPVELDKNAKANSRGGGRNRDDRRKSNRGKGQKGRKGNRDEVVPFAKDKKKKGGKKPYYKSVAKKNSGRGNRTKNK
jgi:ribonuclease R